MASGSTHLPMRSKPRRADAPGFLGVERQRAGFAINGRHASLRPALIASPSTSDASRQSAAYSGEVRKVSSRG